jgi:erythromycin esterase
LAHYEFNEILDSYLRNTDPVMQMLFQKLEPGAEFTKDSAVARQTYIMGFTSFEGSSGRVNTKEEIIFKPRGNSFERWIDKSSSFSFVDFRKYNQKMPNPYAEQFYMAGFGHLSREAPWNKLFDGIFFIRDMFPCNRTF